MTSNRRRIISRILVIIVAINLLYIAVIFNPQTTITHFNLESAKRVDLTRLNNKVVDLYSYNGTVYGIYEEDYSGYRVFAYSDHLIFVSTTLEYTIAQSKIKPKILLVTDFGVFVNYINVQMFNQAGEIVEVFSNPVADTSKSSSQYNSYNQFWCYQTTNTLYKISAVSQTLIGRNEYQNFINIQGWDLISNYNKSKGLRNPDIEQNVFFNNQDTHGIATINFQKKGLMDHMYVLLEYQLQDRIKLSLIDYRINSNGFTQKNVQNYTTSRGGLPNFFIISSTVIKQQTVNSYEPKYLMTNLATNDFTYYTGPSSGSSTTTQMTVIGSSIVIYGGSTIDNQRQSILSTLTLQNNRLTIEDKLINSDTNDLGMIYAITYGDKNVYMATQLTSLSQIQLIAFEKAVKPALFLSGINPGLQLNFVGMLISLIYFSVEFYKLRKKSLDSVEIELYPEYTHVE